MKISADDLLDIMAVASNRIHRELKNAYTTGLSSKVCKLI